jgi:ATP-dependent RNA helicase DDX42
VAARGLDIPNVMVVVNFDAAKNLDTHIHRVGRAGRLQKGSKTGDDGTAASVNVTIIGINKLLIMSM